jgi:tetratricopeptide (TPR) repeat protein
MLTQILRSPLCAPALAAALLCSACAGKKEIVRPVAQVAAPPPRLIDLPPAVSYKEARESMAAGDFATARQKLDVYLSREPKSAAGWFDSGWVAEKLGDPAAAAADYQKALANEPAHLGAALNLIRLDRVQDKIADADHVARATLAKRPDDAQLLDVLAALQRQQGKLDDAAATIRKVLARHPRDADAYKNLAAVEADRGHLRLAESALNNARKLDDKDAGIVNSLGLLAMRRDDTSAARGFFDEATRLDPALAAPWANLGALALQYRDYPAAEQAYGKAVILEPGRWDIHLAHAWALEGLKRPKDARAEYEKVLAARPRQEDALYGRANALKIEGDLPGALEAFKAYALLPKAAKLKEAQAQVASIDLRLKNPPQAAKPAAVAKERGQGAAEGEVDLSKLPVGTDTGPAATQLPSDSPDAAPSPAPEKAPAPPQDKAPKGNVEQPAPAVHASAKAQR